MGEHGVKQLMEVVRKLKSQGVAILFVSHKLEELFELCDRVTVIRDGEHVKTQDIGDWTNDSLIQAMVGRSLDNLFPKVSGTKGECYLEVKNLMERGMFSNISFKAYGGQVLGFAGLVGAGRTEVMRAIFGADKLDGGEVHIRGKRMKFRSPKQAIAAGLAFITEDRKGQGLILDQTIRNNFILATMNKFIKNGFLDEERIESTGQNHISSLKIKTPSIDEVVGKLSGGNQQKVVIGKWVNAEADIYIFDEPTRGIDVGAKIEVYNVINKLVGEGKCVIMVSSELPEILGMSDRVIVMREGKIMGEIERESEQFNSESIMKAAWGGKIA
uniref:sugar ABC transporter ATP-binding protein n=1 Tax=Clostridium sp. NkU-1 TaxID=1095009 RepID=UPI00325FF9AE